MGKKKFLNFAIIGCGSVAIDHAKAIEKLGHKIILGTTKSKNSLNWKIFLKQFPYVKFSSIKKSNFHYSIALKSINFICKPYRTSYEKNFV